MIVEIIKNKQFTDKKGNILNNYKIFLNGKGTWISSLEFSSIPDLIEVGRNYVNAAVIKNGSIETESILTDTIILKEPINDYYIISERQNQTGKFKVLLPKTKAILIEGVVNEPKNPAVIKELGITNSNGPCEMFVIPDVSKNDTNNSIRTRICIMTKEDLATSKTETKNLIKQSEKSEKLNFINNLLDYSVKKNVDSQTRERLFMLIGREVERSGFDIEQIEAIIDEKIKDKIKKNNSLSEEEVQDVEKDKIKKTNSSAEGKEAEIEKTSKWHIAHNPKNTVELLKKFKYNNDSGFKELVHKPKTEPFTYIDYKNIINIAEKSFKELKNIPFGLYKNIEELITLMKLEGELCFLKTKEHPYLNKNCSSIEKDKLEKDYPNLLFNAGGFKATYLIHDLIQGFKRNYRFDAEITEASILRDLIINVFNKASYPKDNLNFEFNTKQKSRIESTVLIDIEFSKHFDDWAIFFTWVPSVRTALREIALDILKHGNFEGNNTLNTGQKKVIFSIDRETDDLMGFIKIPFTIFDVNSICNEPFQNFHQKIMEKKETLKSICDWSIEADFKDGESYRICLLPDSQIPPEKLNSKVGGFKHILTFYEV